MIVSIGSCRVGVAASGLHISVRAIVQRFNWQTPKQSITSKPPNPNNTAKMTAAWKAAGLSYVN